jgi:tRNA uridine 5-carboxymethylaminomethyl modification enzyme
LSKAKRFEELLRSRGSAIRAPLETWLKRPENLRIAPIFLRNSPEIWDGVETDLKYEGYIHREEERIARTARQEGKAIPDWIEYTAISGLRVEATQKLSKIRPETLGQAARISGVTPADIALLTVWIARGERSSVT